MALNEWPPTIQVGVCPTREQQGYPPPERPSLSARIHKSLMIDDQLRSGAEVSPLETVLADRQQVIAALNDENGRLLGDYRNLLGKYERLAAQPAPLTPRGEELLERYKRIADKLGTDWAKASHERDEAVERSANLLRECNKFDSENTKLRKRVEFLERILHEGRGEVRDGDNA